MTPSVKPIKSKTASFDVDAQRCFTPLCEDELPVPGGNEIVAALNYQACFAQYRLGSKDAHSKVAHWVNHDRNKLGQAKDLGPNMDAYWPPHAIPGTPGFELIPGLPKISDYDFFVWKGVELDMHPYGACYHDLAQRMSTGVIEYLQVKGIDTIIVGGLATDYCVKNTAVQLAEAGFRVILNLSACRAISDETLQQAVAAMRENHIEILADLSHWETA